MDFPSEQPRLPRASTDRGQNAMALRRPIVPGIRELALGAQGARGVGKETPDGDNEGTPMMEA